MPNVFLIVAVAHMKYDHRITECWGLEGTSVGHLVQPPAKAGSSRAGSDLCIAMIRTRCTVNEV